MVGTTRSRVNFFMNKFRRLGFVDYDNTDIQIQESLSSVLSEQVDSDCRVFLMVIAP
jgi:hypothetical protein